jgi:hypothetical protein
MAQAMLHDTAARASLPPSFVPSSLSEIVVLSDFWSPIGEVHATLAGLSSTGAHFVEPEGFGTITAGRAESWASDYLARVARHRDEIRAETRRLDWLFSVHDTDRSAAELLLFLHGGMTVNKGGHIGRRA